MRLLALLLVQVVVGVLLATAENAVFIGEKTVLNSRKWIRGGSTATGVLDSYASVCGMKCAVLGDSKVFEEIFNAVGYSSKEYQQGVTIHEGKDGTQGMLYRAMLTICLNLVAIWELYTFQQKSC